MILPKTFDSNEWFIIIALIFTYLMVWLLPKQFPTSITILMLMYGATFARMTDRILGAKPYQLYDMNDTSKFDLMDLLTWCLYPSFGYFFLYLYDKWNLRGVATVIYIVLFAFFSIGFEWTTVKVGIFKYKDWKLSYSYPTYLIVLSSYLLFYHFLYKHYIHKK